MVICLERGADLLMSLPLAVSCFHKIQIGYHPGSPRKRAVKRVCVYVTDSTDSLDCLPIRLSMPVFYFLVFFFPLFSFRFRSVD